MKTIEKKRYFVAIVFLNSYTPIFKDVAPITEYFSRLVDAKKMIDFVDESVAHAGIFDQVMQEPVEVWKGTVFSPLFFRK